MPENQDQQRQQYAASLKAQVSERAEVARARKQAQIEADKEDDARVARESQMFAEQAAAEVQAQRDREALVARREAFAAQQYAQSDVMTREQKIEQYQRARSAKEEQSELFGDDGHGAVRGCQRNIKGLRTASTSQVEAEAGLARAAASGEMRPDQQADAQAAAIRRRAQGSSSLW